MPCNLDSRIKPLQLERCEIPFVIDELDECKGHDVQRQILELIETALRDHGPIYDLYEVWQKSCQLTVSECFTKQKDREKLAKVMMEDRKTLANLQKAMQKVEATLASEREERLWQLRYVAGRTSALEQWAVTGDPEILDRIRLRRLRDEGQAKLARFAGTWYASMTWQLKLRGKDGEPATDDARSRTARSLLADRGGIIPQEIQELMDNEDAMRLLTETN